MGAGYSIIFLERIAGERPPVANSKTRLCRSLGGGGEAHRVDIRTAAYLVGVARVAEATLTRGIYP